MENKELTKRTLTELRKAIEDEVDYVDVKPYSHNIISICLREIARKFGQEDANEAIEDFGLEGLGWAKSNTGEPKEK